MTTTTLFGLALAPLYAAIAQVESDRGTTSDNVYQLRQIYVRDVNRILARNAFEYSDVKDRRKTEKMMFIYWQSWGIHYQKKTGKPVSYEVLARIHNGGPIGWKNDATKSYWLRVSAILKNQTPADVESWSKGGAK